MTKQKEDSQLLNGVQELMLAVALVLTAVLCRAVAGEPVAGPGGELDPRLTSVLSTMSDDDQILAWVYFRDKGSLEHLRNSVPQEVVSARSIERRQKVRPPERLVDYTDLAVDQSYVDQVADQVLRVRQRSKWFNSVSVRATKGQINALEALPFVRKIGLLARFRKDAIERAAEEVPGRQERGGGLGKTTGLDYGFSYTQDSLINVVAVHNTGNYAQGVIVGVLDNGFRLPEHESLDSLDIIATYDFVDHKVSVVPNNPDPSFGSHGMYTLSTIGGYKAGQLVGPAFGASFILARTENDSSETPVEEDNWVAAIEWADSIGVEVTSTSLGYLTYDPPFSSWTWEDMDGNTTVITRAADMAVDRGIVVCNSAGNGGSNSQHNTLIAPADGDSVLSIGAVISTGERAGFSSVGPTTSSPPRIKPDVMAQGFAVYCASGTNPTGYTTASGTSLSCPLAAGVAALIVHARPAATPIEIGDAMRMTASNAGSPDNEYGWGILDAVAAIDFILPTDVSGAPEKPTAFRLEQNFPNPFNPATTIRFEIPGSSGNVSLKVYDLLGRETAVLVNGVLAPGAHTVVWDASDFASGVYFARLRDGGFVQTRKLILEK